MNPSDQLSWRSHTVKVTRRKGIRKITLRVDTAGMIRISAPKRVAQRHIIAFLEQQQDWIEKHLATVPQATTLTDSMLVGHTHRLQYSLRRYPKGYRIREGLVHISTADGEPTQAILQKAATEALRLEAKKNLPPRLALLSEAHGFTYNDVRIKAMRTRWGSCSSKKNINLNLHLQRLPSELVDLVLVHELVHTVHMSHNADFWTTLTHAVPNAKQLTKQLRSFAPHW